MCVFLSLYFRMKIKVLMFGWEFPPHVTGGLGMACYGLTRSLARANVDVTFVLPRPLEHLDQHDFLRVVFAGGSNTSRIRKRYVRTLLAPYMTSESYEQYLERLKKTPMDYALSLIDEVRRYGLLAREIAMEEDYDVIHAHDWLSFAAGVEAKKVSGKPLVVHIHATEFDRTAGHPNQHIYEEERRGFHEADCIIAVSNRTKATVVEHYGIHPDKIIVIHNGVDHDEHGKDLPEMLGEIRAQGKKIVLFFGRITIQKGPDHFLYTARRVLEKDPNVIFVIAGSGDMEHQIIRLAAQLGISRNVIFTGAIWGDDRIRLYRAADLYVMPSVSEPFGITALEALANGTPLLVSKQTGAGEVITHTLKSDFWDVDDMADKILGVLGSRALSESLSEHGLRDVRRATWDSAAGRCVAVYRDLIAKGVA
jgi:glycosyltransferase involved in cell wall biosynthesis